MKHRQNRNEFKYKYSHISVDACTSNQMTGLKARYVTEGYV